MNLNDGGFCAGKRPRPDRISLHGCARIVPILRSAQFSARRLFGNDQELMFRLLTQAMTVSAMLLHSIFGCCTHHAHACDHGHTVENCAARHEAAEPASSRHDHGLHRHLDTRPEHDADRHEHRSDDCPHGPCSHECQNGDCMFTLSPRVKSPTPADGCRWFPLAIAEPFLAVAAGPLFAAHAEPAPPDALATSCRRTMTQVWRL